MIQYMEIVQGSLEWHALRKTKITATDACIIMGASPWKTRLELYHEKLSDNPPPHPNDRMQRGIDLEPIARDLFTIQTGIFIKPIVVVKDWAMASLDGINANRKVVVEIKCPGEIDHAIALQGKIPFHYYPQLQHQMWVCEVNEMIYFSFDGLDGHIVSVKRDDEYIDKMIEQEKKFYECLINRIPPAPNEDDYINREDDLWTQCAQKWKKVIQEMKNLETEEEYLRNELIRLSGQSNTKGAGISLCQIQRKGNVEYTKIPELKNVDLDKYRKQTTISWRISCH